MRPWHSPAAGCNWLTALNINRRGFAAHWALNNQSCHFNVDSKSGARQSWKTPWGHQSANSITVLFLHHACWCAELSLNILLHFNELAKSNFFKISLCYITLSNFDPGFLGSWEQSDLSRASLQNIFSLKSSVELQHCIFSPVFTAFSHKWSYLPAGNGCQRLKMYRWQGIFCFREDFTVHYTVEQMKNRLLLISGG